jgi:hypothetical protein
MKIKIVSICLLLALALGGCKKWIDVTPSDRLTDEQLFSSTEGYLKALNGVYVELANSAIYGEHMTVSTLDVMAGYYYMLDSRHRFMDFATFAYTTDTAKARFDNMWKKSYELIINCNIIIDKSGESGNPLLPGRYYGLVKGEALALRAMLHFDMLRLFGPIYSDANKDKPCIPYNTSSRPQVSALLSSAAIMQNVIADLTAAADLLKDADPIITDGVRYTNDVNGNQLNYRQFRLNYYAVKALLARAYLWMQDKDKAGQEAQNILNAVLDPAKPIFQLGVTNSTALLAEWDHMLVNEVMFSVYTLNRQNIFYNFFGPEVEELKKLQFSMYNDTLKRRDELYDDGGDVRLKAWMIQSTPSGNFLTHVKFGVTAKGPGPNMIPLIRLSEIVLMAAECSNNLTDGAKYLNMVRTGMNCVSLSPTTTTQLKDYITREFRKEVFGEGQMFFYYKRNSSELIPAHAALIGTKKMTLANYTVPLPVSEISVRTN